MPSKKPLIALRLSEALHDVIRSEAERDGRSVSNFLEFNLQRWMRERLGGSGRVLSPGGARAAVYPGRQVDLEDAIVAAVKRGPLKPAKHK